MKHVFAEPEGGAIAVATGILDAATFVVLLYVELFAPFPLLLADDVDDCVWLPPVALALPPVAFPPVAVCDWF